MKCNNCNLEIKQGSKYCSHCGSFNEIDINGNKVIIISDLDEKMMKAFIGGKNPDKFYNDMMSNKLNIYALLFGLFYYAYRGMYMFICIIYLLTEFLNNFINFNIIISSLISGLIFYPLYKLDIKIKIYKLKIKYKYSSELELIEKARQRGGTSVVGVVLLSFIILSFAGLALASLYIFNMI